MKLVILRNEYFEKLLIKSTDNYKKKDVLTQKTLTISQNRAFHLRRFSLIII